jgi:hypothetical protein
MSSFIPSPRIFPWRNWREFENVYQLVLTFAGHMNDSSIDSVSMSDSKVRKEEARLAVIEKLTEWHSRSRCPNAVTATFSLAQLDWVSSKAVLQKETLSPLQLAAAATISRVINALSDSAQSGVFASSISELMKKAGVARWIVDIRHDCSHGAMPSIPVLKLAADYILDYVIHEYWTPQSKLASVPRLPKDDTLLDPIYLQDKDEKTSASTGARRKGDKTAVSSKRKREEDITRLHFREKAHIWRQTLDSIRLSANNGSGGGGGGGGGGGQFSTSPKSSPTSASQSRLQAAIISSLRLVDIDTLEQQESDNGVDNEMQDSITRFPPILQIIIDESAKLKVLTEGITRIVQITVMDYFYSLSKGISFPIARYVFMVRMFSIQAASPDATLRALTFILDETFRIESSLISQKFDLVKFLTSRHWASYFDDVLSKRSSFESTSFDISSSITPTVDDDIHDLSQWTRSLWSQLDNPVPIETLFGFIESSKTTHIASGRRNKRKSVGAEQALETIEGMEVKVSEESQMTLPLNTTILLDRCLFFPLIKAAMNTKSSSLLLHIEKCGFLPLVKKQSKNQEEIDSNDKSNTRKKPRWRL